MFRIKTELTRNYLEDLVEIVGNNIDCSSSLFDTTTINLAKNYFENFEMEFINFCDDRFASCHDFTIHKINERHNLKLANQFGFWYGDKMSFLVNTHLKNNLYKVRAYSEIGENQLVIYKNNSGEILHSGITDFLGGELKVLSKFGNGPTLIHPFHRIEKSYGSNYDVYNFE